MFKHSVVTGLIVVMAATAQAAPRSDAPGTPPDPDVPSVQQPWAPSAPLTYLQVGDVVPGFSFQSADGRWHPFTSLLDRGPVLVLFGADESDLQRLQPWHDAFAEMGVATAAVVEQRSGAARDMARRLGLSCALVSDPTGAIAGLFNSLDPLTHRHAPGFFLVDSERRVRGVYHGALPPIQQVIAATARGLGRPLPESARSLSSRVNPAP